jgi:hypothetical protein
VALLTTALEVYGTHSDNDRIVHSKAIYDYSESVSGAVYALQAGRVSGHGCEIHSYGRGYDNRTAMATLAVELASHWDGCWRRRARQHDSEGRMVKTACVARGQQRKSWREAKIITAT